MTNATIFAANTQFLSAGTVIEFRGSRFTIAVVNTVNYRLLKESNNREYNLKRSASGITVIPNGSSTVPVAPIVHQPVRYTPKLVIGTPVRIAGKTSAQFYGRTGLVCKVNPSTYSVVIKNLGIVNASHHIVLVDETA